MLACLAQSVGVRLCWILTHLTKKNLFIYLFFISTLTLRKESFKQENLDITALQTKQA